MVFEAKEKFMSYTRFAIYYVPPQNGALSDFGAAWLGWDVRSGTHSTMFSLHGLDDITMTPRKYGFHGTLKPPFRLKEGTTREKLEQAVLKMSKGLAPAICDGLQVQSIGHFLALAPVGDPSEIARAVWFLARQDSKFITGSTISANGGQFFS